MKIHLLAIGKLRGAYAELCAEYAKRMTSKIVIREITALNQKAENESLLKAIPEKSFVVALDERGKDLSSRDFAAKLNSWQDQGTDNIVFLVGGADGIMESVKDKADFVLGLGRKTWPHKLARILLLEQLYRAQQINSGHPYHRD